MLSFHLHAQEEEIVLETSTGKIFGTYKLPQEKKNLTLVIIHQGSGPTDRNGNQDDMENNSLKYIADVLAIHGIASLRYDKRGIAESKEAMSDISDITFETYINDLKSWINLAAKDKRFKKIIIVGHSEGSLIGMLAAINNKKVNGYVSIAGPGRAADEIIKDQLKAAPDAIKKNAFDMIDRVKKGDTIENVPPIFYMFLNPSIQPYMRSWFKYNPSEEIKKIKVPLLILQGGNDTQVGEQEAILLSNANKKASLKIIKDMNHTLKQCDTMDKEAQKTFYTNPEHPLHPNLATELVNFVKGI
ncbi:MAG: alpha/beta fold hydrolase [Sphingobacteriaceae bacterium]|nr:alpha/beta fold hydrolase [Sphingobacteriaceae bacterium]